MKARVMFLPAFDDGLCYTLHMMGLCRLHTFGRARGRQADRPSRRADAAYTAWGSAQHDQCIKAGANKCS